MAFNNWPWTSLQNLNLDWILRNIKNAVELATGARDAANEAVEAVDYATNLANEAQRTADTARSEAATAQSTANEARRTADTARSEAATAQSTANTANNTATSASTSANRANERIDALNKNFIVTFTVDNIDVTQITSVTCDTSYSEIKDAYEGNWSYDLDQDPFIITAKVIGPNNTLLFESDTMRHVTPTGSVKAFQFLLALTVGNERGKYIYAFINSNNVANVIEASLPVGGAYVTPEMYGAVGNGVADDTTAVSAAMQNKRVILSKNYKITNTINALAEVVFGNGSAKISSTGGTALNFANKVHISDFGVDIPVQTDGISIAAQNDIVAENIKITGGRIGISTSETSSESAIVRNCSFENMWGDGAKAVYITRRKNVLIEHNYINNVSNNLTVDADGIVVWQDATDQTGKNARIIGNHLHNCRGRFIKAQTVNVVIEDNTMENDSDFVVIHNHIPIDIQRGDSVIRNNLIKSSSGIVIQVPDTTTKVHSVIENNEIVYVALTDSASGTPVHGGIIVKDSHTNETVTANVKIHNNRISGDANNIPIKLAYLPNAIYRVTDNEIFDVTYYALVGDGTQDTTTRFIIKDNKSNGYAYFARFNEAAMPNVDGDDTVNVTTALNFSQVLNNTKFIANTTAITGFDNKAMLSTKGYGNVYCIELAQQNAVGVYKKDGTVIYKFPA